MKLCAWNILLAALLSICIFSAAAFAGSSSTLHIGFGIGSDCATGCGADPNTSGGSPSAYASIYRTSSGAALAIDPVLLILGIPNVDDPNFFTQSSIVDVISINPYPSGDPMGYPANTWDCGSVHLGGGTAFGLGATQGSCGYFGQFTPETRGDVYSFVGLPATNSNNWKNWAAAEAINGDIFGSEGVTSFGIYIFSLHAALGAKGLLNVEFASSETAPIGTYLLGYGQDATGRSYATPFTEAGLQDGIPTNPQPLPEPSSLLLLCCGLLMLGLLAFKRIQPMLVAVRQSIGKIAIKAK